MRVEVKRSIEVAMKLADVLEVSVDYLVGNSDLELARQILNRIQQMAEMPDADRKQIFIVIDALISDFNAKRSYAV